MSFRKKQYLAPMKKSMKNFSPLKIDPDRVFFKSTFTKVYTVPDSSQNYVSKTIRMNNFRDPDPTFTMDFFSSPTGWSYFQSRYRYYLVHGCKITVTFYTDAPDVGSAGVDPENSYHQKYNLALLPIPSEPYVMTAASWEQFIQLSRIKYKEAVVLNSTRKPVKISMYMPVNAIESITKERFRTTSQLKLTGQTGIGQYVGQFGTLATADPMSQPLFYIYAQPTNYEFLSGAFCSPHLRFKVTIKMYTEVFGKKYNTGWEEVPGEFPQTEMDVMPPNVTTGSVIWGNVV